MEYRIKDKNDIDIIDSRLKEFDLDARFLQEASYSPINECVTVTRNCDSILGIVKNDKLISISYCGNEVTIHYDGLILIVTFSDKNKFDLRFYKK